MLGQQWGDEGKGKLVDFLMPDMTLCCRFNGGSNAGHTIVVGTKKVHTHIVPSGIVAGVRCFVGPGTVISFDDLKAELAELTGAGVKYEGLIFVSAHAHVTFPVHRQLDRQRNGDLGTTNKGIGPTYEDKAGRRGIRVAELLSAKQEPVLSRFQQYHAIAEADFVAMLSEARRFFSQFEIVKDPAEFMEHAIRTGRVLIEGANASMLDVSFGTYPFVTSSDCTLAGVFSGLGFSPKHAGKFQVIGVVKAYTTRVGEGVFPSELQSRRIKSDDPRQLLFENPSDPGPVMQVYGSEFGVTTGRLRRCGWLDLVQLNYAFRINTPDCINITKLDVLSHLDEIHVCTAYLREADGLPASFPVSSAEWHHVKPTFTAVPGWKGFDISTCRTYNDLHRNIQAYIELIEKETGIPIVYINTGPERSQMITRTAT